MLNSIDRITWRNGYRLNGVPAAQEEIEPIFDARRVAALSVWEQYEQSKVALQDLKPTPEQYQDACRQIAEALGV
ncbi:hypothetical protein [Serratia fonticola]|uniref:Adenylate cyclase n=1 Tax=Serratia fonticola TaxID=47917 RepID=A0AAW3WQN3_SERFO|nr:hypothetical protein [Serratia fonticola]MBC3213425.1 hypothetical protein [Serratia fonticola]NYA14284.1 hypothetical protein [Serratia fonticola]NYA33926.1 hypothetical protein [Serratia fonticola]